MREFDEISRLDPQKTKLLLEVKLSMIGNAFADTREPITPVPIPLLLYPPCLHRRSHALKSSAATERASGVSQEQKTGGGGSLWLTADDLSTREIVERRRIANEANEKWRNAVKECGHYLVPYPLTGLRGTSGKSV